MFSIRILIYEATLITKCYTQHGIRPYNDSVINHIQILLKFHSSTTFFFFGLISVLRPFDIFKVISGAVSYPNHTVPGQAS